MVRTFVHALAVLALTALAAGCKRERSLPKERAMPAASGAPAADAALALSPAARLGEAVADPAEAALRRARVPGLSFATVRDGRVARCEARGRADAASGRLVMPATLFHAASLAKPIVGMAVVRLVEEGKLALDDDLSAYVGFRVRHPAPGAAPITLRRLLVHAASVRDDLELLARSSAAGDPPLELAPFLRSYVLGPRDAGVLGPFYAQPPGTRSEYSNVGTALAALAVETVVKERFDAYVKRTLFSPLSVSATFRLSEVGPSAIALPHVWRAADRYEARPLLGRPVYPASDLRADACGLARLLAAVINDGALDGVRVLSLASVNLMLAAEPSPSGRSEEKTQGLGWQWIDLGGQVLVGHEGEDEGASALMAIDRARRRGVVLLANGDAFSSGDRTRASALSDLLGALLRD